MKRFHWKLFASSTLLFSVSIENFGPFFFRKNVLLNFKMSQMYVSHSHAAVDLGKILQCGSAKNKTAKLVEDIASEYSVELQALKNLEYFKLKNLSDDIHSAFIHSAREIFFRASKNDFRASRCWLQLAQRPSCKITLLCTLLSLLYKWPWIWVLQKNYGKGVGFGCYIR